MYSKIVDPGSGNPVDVNSRFGKNILKQYVKTAIRLMSGGRVSMPSEYYGKDSGRYSEQTGGQWGMEDPVAPLPDFTQAGGWGAKFEEDQ